MFLSLQTKCGVKYDDDLKADVKGDVVKKVHDHDQFRVIIIFFGWALSGLEVGGWAYLSCRGSTRKSRQNRCAP